MRDHEYGFSAQARGELEHLLRSPVVPDGALFQTRRRRGSGAAPCGSREIVGDPFAVAGRSTMGGLCSRTSMFDLAPLGLVRGVFILLRPIQGRVRMKCKPRVTNYPFQGKEGVPMIGC